MINDDEGVRIWFASRTHVLWSTLNMVDLVPQALGQVAQGVRACLEGGLDKGGGGPFACFAGGALAGTPVGGSEGQGSSEKLKSVF